MTTPSVTGSEVLQNAIANDRCLVESEALRDYDHLIVEAAQDTDEPIGTDAQRAITIVRIMTRGGVDPKRIHIKLLGTRLFRGDAGEALAVRIFWDRIKKK